MGQALLTRETISDAETALREAEAKRIAAKAELTTRRKALKGLNEGSRLHLDRSEQAEEAFSAWIETDEAVKGAEERLEQLVAAQQEAATDEPF